MLVICYVFFPVCKACLPGDTRQGRLFIHVNVLDGEKKETGGETKGQTVARSVFQGGRRFT